MEQATLLSAVMDVLWGDENDSAPKEALAIASYVKSHGRANHDNVFDVLDIVWPDSTITARLPTSGEVRNDKSEVWFDVLFVDESRCLVVANRGIGSAIEVV